MESSRNPADDQDSQTELMDLNEDGHSQNTYLDNTDVESSEHFNNLHEPDSQQTCSEDLERPTEDRTNPDSNLNLQQGGTDFNRFQTVQCLENFDTNNDDSSVQLLRDEITNFQHEISQSSDKNSEFQDEDEDINNTRNSKQKSNETDKQNSLIDLNKEHQVTNYSNQEEPCELNNEYEDEEAGNVSIQEKQSQDTKHTELEQDEKINKMMNKKEIYENQNAVEQVKDQADHESVEPTVEEVATHDLTSEATVSTSAIGEHLGETELLTAEVKETEQDEQVVEHITDHADHESVEPTVEEVATHDLTSEATVSTSAIGEHPGETELLTAEVKETEQDEQVFEHITDHADHESVEPSVEEVATHDLTSEATVSTSVISDHLGETKLLTAELKEVEIDERALEPISDKFYDEYAQPILCDAHAHDAFRSFSESNVIPSLYSKSDNLIEEQVVIGQSNLLFSSQRSNDASFTQPVNNLSTHLIESNVLNENELQKSNGFDQNYKSEQLLDLAHIDLNLTRFPNENDRLATDNLTVHTKDSIVKSKFGKMEADEISLDSEQISASNDPKCEFEQRYAVLMSKYLPSDKVFDLKSRQTKTLDRNLKDRWSYVEADKEPKRRAATLERNVSKRRRRIQPKPAINDDYLYPDSVTPSKVDRGLSVKSLEEGMPEGTYNVPYIDDDAFLPRKLRQNLNDKTQIENGINKNDVDDENSSLSFDEDEWTWDPNVSYYNQLEPNHIADTNECIPTPEIQPKLKSSPFGHKKGGKHGLIKKIETDKDKPKRKRNFLLCGCVGRRSRKS